jgi:N-acyl homoserine lactone hydrolase
MRVKQNKNTWRHGDLARAFSRTLAGVLVCFSAAAGAPATAAVPFSPRLYTLDCGNMSVRDMRPLSDTFEYNGKPGRLSVPCYLIHHPKGCLLWDAGVEDRVAAERHGVDHGGIHVRLPLTLAQQLSALGLEPAQVTYMAFSHFHLDHVGNANAFPAATWIINRKELAWACSEPTPPGINPMLFSGVKTAKTIMIDNDHDVFGDNSVRIFKAPGHTPGHQLLMVKMAHAGPVVLSGDLFHYRKDRSKRLVPAFDHSRADTLASMGRIERIARNLKARILIQHDPEEFKARVHRPASLIRTRDMGEGISGLWRCTTARLTVCTS